MGTFDAILAVVARIPRGRVATYGQVARMAGLPGAARTVGWALHGLPDDDGGARPGAIPWHRVINAAGRVSGRGGERGTCRRQVERLRREGVRPGPGGAYDLERYGWDGSGAPRSAGGPGRRRSPAGRPNCSSHSRA